MDWTGFEEVLFVFRPHPRFVVNSVIDELIVRSYREWHLYVINLFGIV